MERKRSDWDIFVNDFFSPWDSVEVSDRFLGALLVIISQSFVLFIGWCAEGFSLVNLIKSDNPVLPLNLFLLMVATIFFVFFFVFRIIKGLSGFLRYKILLHDKVQRVRMV